MSTLAAFDCPPLIEVVLGVQFSPLENFNAVHIGTYWQNCLGNEWPGVTLVNPLERTQESLSPEGIWSAPRIPKIVATTDIATRVRIENATGDRMVQIQDSWFILNWRKREAGYPSYPPLLEEFQKRFEGFREYVEKSEFPQIQPDLWEVTYINRIPKGSIWKSVVDWPLVIPSLAESLQGTEVCEPESYNGNWILRIREGEGRLRIAIRHVRVSAEDTGEALDVSLTARGPMSSKQVGALTAGLDLGHNAVVRTFLELTSPEAQKVWGRRV